jgi:hypothetical protein
MSQLSFPDVQKVLALFFLGDLIWSFVIVVSQFAHCPNVNGVYTFSLRV